MIEVKSLYKSYDSLTVLKDINITINKSEIVSIVGASGAGKTTLLQIIGTLDKADKGEVWINNKNINQLKDNNLSAFRNKEIGFVFQDYNLIDRAPVLENVLIGRLGYKSSYNAIFNFSFYIRSICYYRI